MTTQLVSDRPYYMILVSGKIIYACTDPNRFARQAAQYAGVSNATLILPTSH